MRSILTLSVATVLAATTLAPAFAASHHHRRAAAPQPAETYGGWQSSQVAAHPNAPAVVNNQPNACFTDEGYGRYASCDQAGD